ncbi:MAG: hypothetical protein A2527_10800 [Candidatus Lambdaproteobacteria bacterium RIFOXYD2_FULL_50_16]|uniref:4-alpha-glucanotransferase n=1 Tax=Candidatus Lambdaproteobacteria bacterium RIFOXYD2_FULL_50_16 TaxID=1817772 RepID=A0A1F6GGC2_9PROT|nr:MAG: hypothetical protein A2527_10800 [Candidatus Lambdaproteobacteria bacterium RIFOXYD2_FULL_50_16]
MKFNLLVGASQINSARARSFGTTSLDGLRHLGEIVGRLGLNCDLYDLPSGAKSPGMASPFSLKSGFALDPLQLDLNRIPEITPALPIFDHLTEINRHYSAHFKGDRTLSFPLKLSLMPWILEACYSFFLAQTRTNRRQAFENFVQTQDYWLPHYALYEAATSQGLSGSGLEALKDPILARAYAGKHQEKIGYFEYVQFLCFEQRRALVEDLRRLKVGLIVNLPFGVEFHSADVFFHPEVFDTQNQVGCGPEPENGYPEQAWGMALYKEHSAGLETYLKERLAWLAQLGDGVFIDHLVGWCGQYALPRRANPAPGQQLGAFLTEDESVREENICWFLQLVTDSGLKVRGEIAGDFNRVEVTKRVALQMAKAGAPISLMMIPRWEREGDRFLTLDQYPEQALLAVETHDTSTLLQYLINQKGRFPDFESPHLILEFCRQVLGIPLYKSQMPLTLGAFSGDFYEEVLTRLAWGSPAKDLLFTLPSLLSWLTPEYRNASKFNNINVQPGTSGEVGNEEGNWSYFSPPISLLERPETAAILKRLGQRRFVRFGVFEELASPAGTRALWSQPKGRQILRHHFKAGWELYPGPEALLSGLIELTLANETDQELEGMLQIASVLKLSEGARHAFLDLNLESPAYHYEDKKIAAEGLYFKLRPGQIHHFLVWPEGRGYPTPQIKA